MESLIQKTYTEISDALNSIYKKRKILSFFQKMMWGITGLFFILMILNMVVNFTPVSGSTFSKLFSFFRATPEKPYASIYPMVILVALLYPTIYFFSNAFGAAKTKEITTIAKMIKMLFPNVEFTQSMAVPNKEVKKSKLFAWVKEGTPIYSYGHLRSTVNDRVINIVDIGMTEKNVSNKMIGTLMAIPYLNIFVILYQYVLKNIFTSKSADNVYYTYRGMFCWLKFKKSLNGHTVILTNNQSSKLDRFFSLNFKSEQKITLEDPRFTDQFIVYSTDQIEARYVLSVALMERILLLKEKFNQPILMSFQDNEMYLAVKNEHGIFSFPAGKIDHIKIIEELAHDIKTALEVSKELKLKKLVTSIVK